MLSSWLRSRGLAASVASAASSRALSAQPSPREAKGPAQPRVPEEMRDPLQQPDFFGVRGSFSVKELMDARVHFGHTRGTLNEHMRQFVLGERLGTLIFDLDRTAELLRAALNFAAHVAFLEGIVLFVSRHKQHSFAVEEAARGCGEYSQTKFWPMGSFTDSSKRFGSMTRLPDLLIFLNTLDSAFDLHRAVLEANKLLIPSIGVVDTNCFPNFITYPVPGNDDSLQSVELFCRLFTDAIQRGKARRKEYVQMYGEDFEELLKARRAVKVE